MILIPLGALFLLVVLTAVAFYVVLRRRGFHRCFVNYMKQTPRRRLPNVDDNVHVLICFADHFEPIGYSADAETARRCVEDWARIYPQQFSSFRDNDGKPPRYTFFFPAEEYEPAYLDALAALCRQGFGEVEIHLHHDHDSAENLAKTLLDFKDILARQHGLLAKDPRTGEIFYSFIHGNWALCNAHGDGRHCGVNEEIDVLLDTGCYADFTMPSAPHSAQTAKVNSIYYATTQPNQSRSHDFGVDAGIAVVPDKSLLLIQGPLLINWAKRRNGIIPTVENGCIQGTQPPQIARLDNWLRAAVQVPTRPDWYFVKLHMHGAEASSMATLLGEPMVQFHRDLAERANQNPRFRYHYVTAREMYNLVKAAEDGWTGSVDDARDYKLVWNGKVQKTAPAESISETAT